MTSELKRSLGFWALTAYGVGDILGAGIYSLVGEIAGVAGHASWISFAVALCVASLTGFSYAELAGRFPYSGGEAYFSQQAFGSRRFASFVGWLVFASSVVSMATVSHAFARYLGVLVPELAGWSGQAFFLIVVAAVNFRGIKESSTANIVFTLIEASGVILVIAVGATYLSSDAVVHAPAVLAPPVSPVSIGNGAALAFFAFIGFEDMVNVAEEVRSPGRNMPAAIATSMGITGVLYILVCLVATQVVSPAELAATDVPLLAVITRAAPSIPAWSFTLVALVAVANTGLLNGITASRLLYGMSRQELLPVWMSRVGRNRQTPHFSIMVVLTVGLVLALSGSLAYLAETTSVLLLLVFGIVNIALIVIKRGRQPFDGFTVPLVIPSCGAVASFVLIGFVKPTVLLISTGIVLVGCVLLGVQAVRQFWKRRN